METNPLIIDFLRLAQRQTQCGPRRGVGVSVPRAAGREHSGRPGQVDRIFLVKTGNVTLTNALWLKWRSDAAPETEREEKVENVSFFIIFIASLSRYGSTDVEIWDPCQILK